MSSSSELLRSPFTDMSDEEFTKKYGKVERFRRPNYGLDNPSAGKFISDNSLFERVGNREKTNSYCGMFKGFYGCLHEELHHVKYDGVDYQGKIFVKKVFHSCDKPTCKICFKHGWAVREASNMTSRFAQFSKKYGQVEHIINSVPSSDYNLTFPELNAKCVTVLKDRGIIGGAIVFHAERYRSPREAEAKGLPKGWTFSPHYHVMGFIKGGYSRCRNCYKNTEDCLKCSGFKGRQRRAFLKEGGRFGVGGGSSGYIVDVKDERKSVHGSCWYELHHCSIINGQKKFQPVRWFGVCAKNKERLKKEDRIKDVCPICGHELVELKYVGNDDPLAEYWVKEFFDDLCDEHGNVKWIEMPKRMGAHYE
jgi:hypothetical protein